MGWQRPRSIQRNANLCTDFIDAAADYLRMMMMDVRTLPLSAGPLQYSLWYAASISGRVNFFCFSQPLLDFMDPLFLKMATNLFLLRLPGKLVHLMVYLRYSNMSKVSTGKILVLLHLSGQLAQTTAWYQYSIHYG